jgi:hypothetical protein
VAGGTQRYGCHITVSDALLKCAVELQLHRSQEHDLVATGALGTEYTIRSLHELQRSIMLKNSSTNPN